MDMFLIALTWAAIGSCITLFIQKQIKKDSVLEELEQKNPAEKLPYDLRSKEEEYGEIRSMKASRAFRKTKDDMDMVVPDRHIFDGDTEVVNTFKLPTGMYL